MCFLTVIRYYQFVVTNSLSLPSLDTDLAAGSTDDDRPQAGFDEPPIVAQMCLRPATIMMTGLDLTRPLLTLFSPSFSKSPPDPLAQRPTRYTLPRSQRSIFRTSHSSSPLYPYAPSSSLSTSHLFLPRFGGRVRRGFVLFASFPLLYSLALLTTCPKLQGRRAPKVLVSILDSLQSLGFLDLL